MEKVVLPLWRPAELSPDGFREALLTLGSAELCDKPGVRALRLAVADSAVEPAAAKRMASFGELPDAVLSVWLDAVTQTPPLQQSLATIAARCEAYLVTESEQILNAEAVDSAGRVPGFCQVVFLQRPDRLSEQEWLSIWQGSHTEVAIRTQSTFGYRQNVIVRSLTAPVTPYSAMIEENFPAEAMTSDHAFYAASDDEMLRQNSKAMLESCARFIDFDRISVIPMSEYLLKRQAGT